MTDRLIFLSHAAEEADLAALVKSVIGAAFSDAVDVFVSSDAQTLRYGREWFAQVAAALKSCIAQLILCSPNSMTRPWIYFEAGVCWERGVPVVPLCHSGLERSRLPQPLATLQAANLGDKRQFSDVLQHLHHDCAVPVPTAVADEFFDAVRAHEERYTFWDQFATALGTALENVGRNGARAFLTGCDTRIGIKEPELDRLQLGTRFFQSHRFVCIERDGSQFSDGYGDKFGINLIFSDEYRERIAEYLLKKSRLQR